MAIADSIAIDGPAASGKTAVGRKVARRLGYDFIDTGLMYRACTYLAIEMGLDMNNREELGRLAKDTVIEILPSGTGERLEANGRDITSHLRNRAVEEVVSEVSSVREVRDAMVRQQRNLAEQGGMVMVGRDIGTKVLPEAMKVYLEASLEERVTRRLRESTADIGRAQLREMLASRDKMDEERAESPLTVAEGSLVIATDRLSIAEVATIITKTFLSSRRT